MWSCRTPLDFCVCFIVTRKILGFYISVVNSSVIKVGWDSVSQNWVPTILYVCGITVIMLQDHRYLEPPILGVRRRFHVKRQHPNSQTTPTSLQFRVLYTYVCIHLYILGVYRSHDTSIYPNTTGPCTSRLCHISGVTLTPTEPTHVCSRIHRNQHCRDCLS